MTESQIECHATDYDVDATDVRLVPSMKVDPENGIRRFEWLNGRHHMVDGHTGNA